MAGARHGIGAALFELHALFVARPRSRGARVETMSAVAVAPVVAPQTASRAVSSRPARGARWGRVGPPGARRAFSFPADAPGGGASTSSAPPAVPPPRGEGSAAAALQAADSWRDVLAASTLVVLPDEESVAWQRQRIHRKRRAGGAARALGRIARWLAARDKLGAGGEREQCVNDARFARLVAAAAAPTTEGGAGGGGGGGGGARVDDDDDEEESAIRSSSAHRPHPSPPSPSLTAEERAGDVADALEALRALGSLAPLPWVDERHPGDPVAMRPRVSKLIQTVASSQPSIAPHDATPAAWACDRLGLFSGVNETNDDDGWDAATRRAGDVIARAAEGLPFKILPDLTARIAGVPRGEFGDSARRLDLDLDRELTVEALAAEVPFRAEKLVTRDGKRVDERRETCWMAEEGIGGLAYSGKVMSPAPFTPTIRALRDAIEASTGERFDCALLNLYPGGDVACKYHRDPDLGVLWARDSIIVSVGETRRFAFRELGKNEDEAHWFRLRSGDCVWMFANCNDDWEHCVMRAEGAAGENDGSRASVVFKRALAGRGRRGHGMVGEGRRAGRKKKAGPARGSASGPDPIRVKSGGAGRGGRGGAGRRRGRGGAGRGGGGRGGG